MKKIRNVKWMEKWCNKRDVFCNDNVVNKTAT